MSQPNRAPISPSPQAQTISYLGIRFTAHSRTNRFLPNSQIACKPTPKIPNALIIQSSSGRPPPSPSTASPLSTHGLQPPGPGPPPPRQLQLFVLNIQIQATISGTRYFSGWCRVPKLPTRPELPKTR